MVVLVWSALAIYLAETAALLGLLWARHIDWQAPLIGIDVATRCVSVLWLLILPGIQRRPRPLPCCYHRSEMGVTLIKSAPRHSLCVACICVTVTWRVCLHLSLCVCMWVCISGCTQVSPPSRLFCCIGFTFAPLIHTLISHSTPTHLPPPASPLNLRSTQNQHLQWQLRLGGMAKIWSHFWRENYGSAFAFLNIQIICNKQSVHSCRSIDFVFKLLIDDNMIHWLQGCMNVLWPKYIS